MKYIRETYNVPAKRGARVRFSGHKTDQIWEGTIVASRDQYLLVRPDPEYKLPFERYQLHPTWKVEYL